MFAKIIFKKRLGVPILGQLTVDFLKDILYDKYPQCGYAISQLSGEGEVTYAKKFFCKFFAIISGFIVVKRRFCKIMGFGIGVKFCY